MSTAKKWFAFMVVAAFISVISFFQINSAFADKANINGLFTVGGILFALIACYCLYRVTQNAN